MSGEIENIYTSVRNGLVHDFSSKDFRVLATSLEYFGAPRVDIELILAISNIEPKLLPKIANAFSKGQIASKKWLIEKLLKVANLDSKEVLILGGWIGLLPHFLLKSLDGRSVPRRIYSLDIDPECAPIVDAINRSARRQDWKVKGVTLDMNALSYTGDHISAQRTDGSECELYIKPDFIINSSTEHIPNIESWWSRVPKGMGFVLQSNNLFSEPSHVSCVNSLAEMKRLFPADTIDFAGELDLGAYERYMLIGRK